MPLPKEIPFVVLLLGEGDNVNEYADWIAQCEIPPIVITSKGGDIRYDELSFETFKARFQLTAARLHELVQSEDSEKLVQAIDQWSEPIQEPLGYELGGHASISPNMAVLNQFGLRAPSDKPFAHIHSGIGPYVDQIVQTTETVFDQRYRVRVEPFNRLFAPRPDLNLFAPSIYRDMKIPTGKLSREDTREFRAALDMLERQSGYSFDLTASQKGVVVGKRGLPKTGNKIDPHPLLRIRQRELFLATAATTALSVSDLSATIRLPNSINRTAGAVRQFAAHYRSEQPKTRKRVLAFRTVQNSLATAFPSEFRPYIEASQTGIRIISDAHLEWLDMDGLPLGIRKNVSRIPVTPGNLFVEQCLSNSPLHLSEKDLNSVLILSALEREDVLRKIFQTGLDTFGEHWEDRISLRIVDVKSKADFAAALSDFDGNIALFDGHGSHAPGKPGVLHFRDDTSDIWELHGTLGSVPPIMVLSACDTFAADRNHASTANGFLALGVRAVLGSVFPLTAFDAATFTARLLYRVADFIPAACEIRDGPMTWTEVVGGMMRMQLMTDFLRSLLHRNMIDQERYLDVALRGNYVINTPSPTPFEDIVDYLVDGGIDRPTLWNVLEVAVANSSVISYVNLGRPDTILVDSSHRIRATEAEFESWEKEFLAHKRLGNATEKPS